MTEPGPRIKPPESTLVKEGIGLPDDSIIKTLLIAGLITFLVFAGSYYFCEVY